MMNNDEREEVNPPFSILQRLDRLEHQMLFLEERHGYGAPNLAVVADKCLKPEEQCKSMFSALEEVHHKGSLLERVAVLENRLIQLSRDMDLENTSRSSSSNAAVTEKLGNGLGSLEARGPNEGMNMITTIQEKQGPFVTQGEDSIVLEACSLNSPSCRAQRRRIKAISRMGCYRMLKWLKLGC
ncbi:hypothetical protein AAZX31_09G177800 [Glycine max]|uniref:Uncharacterized protein n=3 Tax=Glycine subgen. Soja TaxID=1462606 RepID=I1L4M9_SOYBN|nr:uncharacterized protein LOC100809085 [Glycine max]XP_028180439.1 uncharacterized protein LOC114367446 isoform X1 [Glycine soja]KAG4992113.1 hypothetical protein JHK87_025570 [Glycine soja]KAG5013495.1 hypothetical protein JHK86_025756 [Glycine max]KAG5134441.1 hypothetical protein JHK82_025629 [Glycine max]KAH1043806.1 hypothetical protein GYH30_025574 [Glycine max]KAH1234332.1 hypothetical protein GmHk_09G026559 [Glycine max]|eukprot:XP_003534222.1 uncharacterized protein LOC100809085 isoform X1 [Glycine max]